MSKRQSKLTSRKQEWTQKALDVLALEGTGSLTIEHICHELGVTRGSFYWHFGSREDFRLAIMDYWFDISTRRVASLVEKLDGSPEKKLEKLGTNIIENNLTKYDLPIRYWARTDPNIRAKLNEVDAFRYRFVRDLFSQTGFSGTDLELRTSIFVNDMNATYLYLDGKNKSVPSIKKRLRFYTKR